MKVFSGSLFWNVQNNLLVKFFPNEFWSTLRVELEKIVKAVIFRHFPSFRCKEIYPRFDHFLSFSKLILSIDDLIQNPIRSLETIWVLFWEKPDLKAVIDKFDRSGPFFKEQKQTRSITFIIFLWLEKNP